MLKAESYKSGIITSTIFNFVSKGFGFCQGVVIAFYFGTQTKTDIFFYLFAIILMISTYVNTLDLSVLIPEATRIRICTNNQEAISFLNFFLYLYLLIGVAITLIIYCNPIGVFKFLSNFDEVQLEKNRSLIQLLVPLFTLVVMTNFCTNILTSYRYFTMPMIVSIINNIFTILFVILFSRMLDIKSIAWGLIVAYVLNFSLHIYVMKRKLEWFFGFKRVYVGKNVWKNISYAQLGNITSVVSSYVPLYLFSGFTPGLISAFNYGKRTADLPNQMFLTQFSSVIGIKLNEAFAADRLNELSKSVEISLVRCFLFFIPISCICFMNGNFIISLLYSRGSFNNQSVVQAAFFFKYLSLLLPLLAVNVFISRFFMATQTIKIGMYYQIFFNLIYIAALWIFISLAGYVAYPIIVISVYFLNIFGIKFLVNKYFKYLNYNRIIALFFKILIGNIGIVAIIYCVNELFPDQNDLSRFIYQCLIYMILIWVFNAIFRFDPELKGLVEKKLDMLKKRFVNPQNVGGRENT